MSRNIHTFEGRLGIQNNSPSHDFSIGSNLQVNDTVSNVLTVVGNVKATRFLGDGGLLSNITSVSTTLQAASDNGNTTSNTLQFTNTTTGFVVDSNIVVGGNVTATTFLGDGGLLSNISGVSTTLQGVSETGNTTSNTLQFTNTTTGFVVDSNIVVGGNVTATTFLGDGGLLSNITTVSSTLQDISDTGNTTSNTLQFTNTTTGLVVDSNIVVGGNVTATTFLGDGGLLSNIATTLQAVTDNGNTSSNTLQFTNTTTGLVVDSNIVVGGNVTATTFLGDGGLLSNIATTLQAVTDNGNTTSNTLQFTNTTTGLVVDSNIVVGGNVTATTFLGDGGLLSNIATTLQAVTDNGNTTSNTLQFTNTTTGLVVDSNIVVGGNVTATTFLGDGGLLSNITATPSTFDEVINVGNTVSNVIQFIQNETYDVGFITQSNVGIQNTAPTHNLSVGSNLHVDDTGSNVLTVLGNTWTQNLTLGTINTTPAYGLENVTEVGNATSDTIQLTNSTTGLVTTSNVQIGGTLKFGGVIDFSNPLSLAAVSNVGNTTPYTIEFTNPTTGFETTSNAVIGDNLEVGGNVSVSGSITKTLYNPGEIIETLFDTCSSTSLYGRATMQSVTGKQSTTTTFTDVTGSVITGYTPPDGAKTIVYEYNVFQGRDDPRPIIFWGLFCTTDGTNWVEVTKARTIIETENYLQTKLSFKWPFKIGASSNDASLGTFTASRPTLGFKWQFRSYNSTYDAEIHTAKHWEGETSGTVVTADQFSIPSVSITAIA